MISYDHQKKQHFNQAFVTPLPSFPESTIACTPRIKVPQHTRQGQLMPEILEILEFVTFLR
ncbi:hypothetical protein BofuT4_uP032900.1 [Botrytis cinerea T4]|uniref:Uncharacterized protein n=1 Tax=Botryotinia fuckeliana (strain T4) TaxID=999810 RepID=G2Y8F2_BOTF4|nr:hypothetical protein BofuT4_uP032900.1 [Botrytis cinerea T4]